MEISSPEHFKALGHPTRHRLLFALGERPATISQLAVALGTRKGNVAHHLKVLVDAGLVRPAHTQQVRGGTEQYYTRVPRTTVMRSEHYAENLPVAFRAIADEIVAARPDPLLILRYLRLSPAQVEELTALLTSVAQDTEEAAGEHPRYGLLIGLYQPAPPGDVT